MNETRLRTKKQNRAAHKFFKELSDELNNAGISQKLLIEGLEVEHTEHSVKSVFRAIGRAKFGKLSTADLTTKELHETFEEMSRICARLGIVIGFPSYEDSEEYLQSYKN